MCVSLCVCFSKLASFLMLVRWLRLEDDRDAAPVAGAGPLGGLGLLPPDVAEVLGNAHGVGGGARETTPGETDGVETRLTLPPVGEGRLGVSVLVEEIGALKKLEMQIDQMNVLLQWNSVPCIFILFF